MLYLWEVGRADPADVLDAYWQLEWTERGEAGEPVRAFAEELFSGTVSRLAEIDPLISESAEHWRLSRMAVVDRLILRLAVYELLYSPQTPAAVIINEALELARTFSEDEAVRFVNGILDRVRRKVRKEPD
jgi:transcription antitermination protein NusB